MAVDAADAAGGKHPDAGHCRAHHGGGDGGGAGFAGGQVGGKIAPADFADVFTPAHQLQLLGRETDLDPAADERHGGGVGAALSNLLFHLRREGEIFGIGHPVAENGAFQRHDRLAVFQRLPQLRTDIKVFFEIHVRCSSCKSYFGNQKVHRLGRTLHR